MNLSLVSFAFKNGIPAEAEMVFDARFLKNPHYNPDLQHLTGLDAVIGPYIETDPDFALFFAHISEMLVLVLPRFAERGNEIFTIATGCTGGKHRSVYLTQKLGAFLENNGYKVAIRHRDLEKNT